MLSTFKTDYMNAGSDTKISGSNVILILCAVDPLNNQDPPSCTEEGLNRTERGRKTTRALNSLLWS